MVLAVAAFLRQRSSARLVLQEQTNLRRQEELNERLEESNALLAKSKEAAEQAMQIAETANKAKSAFLGSVSHDIRTPMNAIVGFTTLLKDETDNPAVVQEYAGRIETASQHLLSLINDVLDINKIESGSATLNLVEMNLAEVIDEINAIIRPQAKAKDQTFDIAVAPLKYEHLQGDKLRIQEWEYDPKFWAGCGVKRMLVADDEEDACRSVVGLMEPTGVEVHTVHSGEDAFHRLCFAREAGQPYNVVLLDWKMPRMSGLETARIILVKILSTLGAACDTADNGQEAVDKFNASRPGDYDLILMDVQMPVLDSKMEQASDSP